MILQWLRRAQRSLSSIASNYNMSRIVTGQVIACVSLVFALVAAAKISKVPAASWTLLAVLSGAYGAMMFASSYVEEEQHFWYWATTAWLFVLGMRGLKRYACCCRCAQAVCSFASQQLTRISI